MYINLRIHITLYIEYTAYICRSDWWNRSSPLCSGARQWRTWTGNARGMRTFSNSVTAGRTVPAITHTDTIRRFRGIYKFIFSFRAHSSANMHYITAPFQSSGVGLFFLHTVNCRGDRGVPNEWGSGELSDCMSCGDRERGVGEKQRLTFRAQKQTSDVCRSVVKGFCFYKRQTPNDLVLEHT